MYNAGQQSYDIHGIQAMNHERGTVPEMQQKRKITFSPPDVGPAELEAIGEVLESGWITTGPKTKEFEQRIAAYTGASSPLSVSASSFRRSTASVAVIPARTIIPMFSKNEPRSVKLMTPFTDLLSELILKDSFHPAAECPRRFNTSISPLQRYTRTPRQY